MGCENFIEMFNSLSHKRRQGILRVSSQKERLEIQFVDGRITGVEYAGKNLTKALCERLCAAGVIHRKVCDLFEGAKVSVPQLFDLLVSKKFVTPKDFQRVKLALEMDLLHSMRVFEDAALDFQPKDLRADPRFPATVSPSQVLLDLYELENDEERFEKMSNGGTGIVSRKADRPRSLHGYEAELWDLLEEERSVAGLFHSLLSAYEVQEGLLSLFDQGLISIGGKEDETVVSAQQPPESAAIPRAVQSEWDGEDALQLAEVRDDFYGRIATEAVDSLLDGFDDDLLIAELETEMSNYESASKHGEESVPTPKALISNVDASDHSHPSMLEREQSRAIHEVKETAQLVNEIFRFGEALGVGSESDHINSLNSEHVPEHTKENSLPEPELYDKLLWWNYHLLEKDVFQNVILGTVLAFLFCVLMTCLFTSAFLEGWFRALVEFSSTT